MLGRQAVGENALQASEHNPRQLTFGRRVEGHGPFDDTAVDRFVFQHPLHLLEKGLLARWLVPPENAAFVGTVAGGENHEWAWRIHRLTVAAHEVARVEQCHERLEEMHAGLVYLVKDQHHTPRQTLRRIDILIVFVHGAQLFETAEQKPSRCNGLSLIHVHLHDDDVSGSLEISLSQMDEMVCRMRQSLLGKLMAACVCQQERSHERGTSLTQRCWPIQV